MWNWQLRDNFVKAAQLMGYEVTVGRNHYTIEFPKGCNIYCYLWHPLNKMDDIVNYDAAVALMHIKNNQSDFHIEIERRPKYGNSISYLFPELYDTPDVATIVQCIYDAQNDEVVSKLQFLHELTYGSEE